MPGVKVKMKFPEKIKIYYIEDEFKKTLKYINRLVSMNGREVFIAWIGHKAWIDEKLIITAIKSLIIEENSASGSHTSIFGERLTHIDNFAEKFGLKTVALIHTHNWPSGHKFFSSIDRETAKLLSNPELVLGVLDPFTGNISHWRWFKNNVVRDIDFEIIDTDIKILKRDGNIVNVPVEEEEVAMINEYIKEYTLTLGEMLVNLDKIIRSIEIMNIKSELLYEKAKKLSKNRKKLLKLRENL